MEHEMTIGRKIAQLRREKELTQEEMAEKLGVSPQAVSKWENDVSCPDILLLPKIGALLGVTVDELLSGKPKKETTVLPEQARKRVDDMMLRIRVNSAGGDRVRVNLPMALVKMAMEMGVSMPQVSGNEALRSIDFEQLLRLVDSGLIGKLVEVETADGDIVEIVVE